MPAEFPCIDEEAKSRSINDGILYAILISTLISLSIREYSSLRCHDSSQNATWRTRNTIHYSHTLFYIGGLDIRVFMSYAFENEESISLFDWKKDSRTRIKDDWFGQFSLRKLQFDVRVHIVATYENAIVVSLSVSFTSPLIRRGDPRTNAITSIINLDSRSRHVIVNAIIHGATGKSWNNGRTKDA